MTNNQLTTKKVIQLTLLSCMLTAISACSSGNGSSGSGSNNTDNGDVSSLQIITPKTIYSKPGVAGSSYVVINNPTAIAVKNVQYSLSNQIGSGSGASVDPASAANCATIAAYSQCNIKVTVPAGAVAGSLGLNISNNTSLLSKLSKAAKAVTPTMGIEQAAYNNLSGADGITLSYYHTVINGTPYILVSGLVASATAGTFNRIVLVDGNGIALPNQRVIGSINSNQGSTFNVLLPIPVGANLSQTIKVQTQQNGAVVSTASSSSTLTTAQNVGIAEMLPGAVYLTESNPEQIITFLNTGDAAAQLQKLVSNNSNVEVIFTPASLTSGATAIATLKLKNKTIPATTGNVTLTYNNGQSETVTSGVIAQNVNPAPTPSPGPTPTPPAPSPTPVAGLNAVFSPDNDFFKTSAGAPVTRELTLTNTGNTDENAIVLNLPANFTIASGSSNGCIVSGHNISNTLTPGGATDSCTVTVTYNNSNVVDPAETADISIAYNYNNGTAADPVIEAVNYKVTQSTAILSLTSPWNPYNFINIEGNNADLATQIFTLHNSGEIDATNVTGAITVTSPPPPPFSIVSNYGSTISAGGDGNLTLQFGPSSDLGAYDTTLTVSYEDYLGHAAMPITVDITGSVSNAVAYLDSTADTGFDDGNGQTVATAYTLQKGTTGQITLTYKNKGNETAQNFKLDVGTISSKLNGTPFTLITDDCNLDNGGIDLQPDQTCDEVLDYSPTVAGEASLPLNTSDWEFSYSDTHGSYTYNSAPIYFKAYALPQVTITSVTSWQTMMGSSYAFMASITDGSSTVTPIVAGLTGDTVSPSSCDLNSTTTSCIFLVTPYTGTGYYSFWDPTNVVNSTDVANPATANTNSGVSLNIVATNNASINNGAAQPFSITGKVIAPYVYLPQTGQTPTSPINVTSINGADGNVHAGIPWAYVTSGSTTPNPRFEETYGGCAIKDNLTGLIWVKNLSTLNTSPRDWNSALFYVANGTWCGRPAQTWRVPNVNELRSLINYEKNEQFNWLTTTIASGGGGFTGVQMNNYWSSSSIANDTSKAWLVNMRYGHVTDGDKSNTTDYKLFVVSGGQ